MNVDVAARYADLMPGAATTVRELRALGLKIGSTTGYTRDIIEGLWRNVGDEGLRKVAYRGG